MQITSLSSNEVWGVCNVVTELTVTRQEWRYYTPRHHKNVFIKPRYCIFCIKDLQPARLFCPDQLFSIKVCLSFVCLMLYVCWPVSQSVWVTLLQGTPLESIKYVTNKTKLNLTTFSSPLGPESDYEPKYQTRVSGIRAGSNGFTAELTPSASS